MKEGAGDEKNNSIHAYHRTFDDDAVMRQKSVGLRNSFCKEQNEECDKAHKEKALDGTRNEEVDQIKRCESQQSKMDYIRPEDSNSIQGENKGKKGRHSNHNGKV